MQDKKIIQVDKYYYCYLTVEYPIFEGKLDDKNINKLLRYKYIKILW